MKTIKAEYLRSPCCRERKATELGNIVIVIVVRAVLSAAIYSSIKMKTGAWICPMKVVHTVLSMLPPMKLDMRLDYATHQVIQMR